MTPLRLALLAVASISGWCPCGADVGDFAPCLSVFYRSWPPKGLAGTPICQRYSNQYRFATLYSRPRRSPLFSAYLYTAPTGKRPTASWKFEPQVRILKNLVCNICKLGAEREALKVYQTSQSYQRVLAQLAYPEADGNMTPFPPGPLDQNVVDSQAVEPDYINSTYSRGHLNPSLHHRYHEDRSSTFTLTNVVPQKVGSNDGPWEVLEQAVNITLGTYCVGDAYVVTGIIPYQKDERWLKNHRVAVAEYLWTAHCCPNYNNSLPKELQDAFPTYAAIGRNDPNSTEEIVPVNKTAKKQFRGFDVRQMSLDTLEMYLKDRFRAAFSVFYEQCNGSETD